jgi:hypothetical protein
MIDRRVRQNADRLASFLLAQISDPQTLRETTCALGDVAAALIIEQYCREDLERNQLLSVGDEVADRIETRLREYIADCEPRRAA